EVLKRTQLGRLAFVMIGRAPSRVLRFLDDDPLLDGFVDYLEARDRTAAPGTRRELVELYEACHTMIFGDYPKNLETDEDDNCSYRVAGTLPLDLMWKQQILELRTEADRQERLVAYLRAWAPHLQQTAELRHHSIGDGHELN